VQRSAAAAGGGPAGDGQLLPEYFVGVLISILYSTVVKTQTKYYFLAQEAS
jgi:hypothetical protein